jgi:excisionase family DNA binding protein
MPLLTTQQAAEELGITRQAVGLLIRNGTLPAKKQGRDWAIDSRDMNSGRHRPKIGRPKDAISGLHKRSTQE